MDEPLENMYFDWLIARVLPEFYLRHKTPSTSYDILLKTLHNTEFIWLLSGDDNRAADGKELRAEFLIVGHFPDDPDWRTLFPCSVLEMLIAFAFKRCEFNSDISARDWFWEMLDNLNLKDLPDASFMSGEVDAEEVFAVLEHFMWRQYNTNGDGGLFPLDNPQQDQTQTEIWHQFCDYLVDKNRLPA